MKLAVATCDPGPGRFGPIFAVPRTAPSWSTATEVRPGGRSTHTSRNVSGGQSGSYGNVSAAVTTSARIGPTWSQSASV